MWHGLMQKIVTDNSHRHVTSLNCKHEENNLLTFGTTVITSFNFPKGTVTPPKLTWICKKEVLYLIIV